MFTKITDIGKTKIAALTFEQKIRFTKYKVGILPDNLIMDLHEVEFDPNATFLQSNVALLDTKYTADEEQILYRFMDVSNTVLKVYVPQDYAFFRLNCVVFYAAIGADEFPFIVSYALEINPKFSTLINKYGTRYFFMLHLDLTNRETRYDFTNLQIEAPEFAVFDHNYFTPNAYKVKQDQAIIENHMNIPADNAVFAVESQGYYFGVVSQRWNFDENYQQLQLGEDNLQLDGEDLYFGVKPNHGLLILTGE